MKFYKGSNHNVLSMICKSSKCQVKKPGETEFSYPTFERKVDKLYGITIFGNFFGIITTKKTEK